MEAAKTNMNIEEQCKFCKYLYEEYDMGGGTFYVCGNLNFKSSFPEFKEKICPNLERKVI